MKLALKFAFRYFFSKKSLNVVHFISGISVLGITVGSLALILVLSFFNGLDSLVVSLMNSFNPDIKITAIQGKVFTIDNDKLAKIADLDNIEAISFALEETVLLRFDDKKFFATVKGVDDNFLAVNRVDTTIINGKYLTKYEGNSSAVLGSGVAMALNAEIGDPFQSLRIYFPKRGKQQVMSIDQVFTAVNVFPAGVFNIQSDFDSKYVLTNLELVQEKLKYKNGEISAIELKLENYDKESDTKSTLMAILGDDFTLKNRHEQEATFYAIMNAERWAVFSILTFILIIAAFNMIGALSMLVLEKRQDIMVLKAMGAENKLIQQIFLAEGMLLAFAGMFLGFFLAIIIVLLQQNFGLLELSGNGGFVTNHYPVELRFFDFLLVGITVFVIALLASWYPSRKAAKQTLVIKEG